MHRDHHRWYSHRLMEGMYDDNFYFNNPVDYMSTSMTRGISIRFYGAGKPSEVA